MPCPLYIHPSESAGIVLVPVPFDGFGFRSWKRGVLCSLTVKNKLGFINGNVRNQLKRLLIVANGIDAMPYWLPGSWIPSLRIVDSVEYVFDLSKLWSELQDRYDQTNEVKLYQILMEINDLGQGNLDITFYQDEEALERAQHPVWRAIAVVSVLVVPRTPCIKMDRIGNLFNLSWAWTIFIPSFEKACSWWILYHLWDKRLLSLSRKKNNENSSRTVSFLQNLLLWMSFPQVRPHHQVHFYETFVVHQIFKTSRPTTLIVAPKQGSYVIITRDWDT